jgi:hypothetical protein
MTTPKAPAENARESKSDHQKISSDAEACPIVAASAALELMA